MRNFSGSVLAGVMMIGLSLTPFYALASTQSYYGHTEELKKLIDFVHTEQFDEALAIAASLVSKYPESPVGYFYQAAIYDTIIRDYCDHRFEAPFEVSVNASIDLGEKFLKNGEKKGEHGDPWTHFYLGGALGFRGLYKFIKNDYFGAFYDGISAVNHLKTSAELDPELYDIYYGLGCFYYWTSAKSRLLWFLPFVSDKRQQGINQLILAVNKGTYTNVEAQYALLRVYNSEKMYDQTLSIGQELREKFPQDIFVLNEMSYAYRDMGQWENVVQVEQKIIDRCMLTELHCFERIAQSSLYRAQAFANLKNWQALDVEYTFIVSERRRRENADEQINDLADGYIKKIKKLISHHK